MSDIAIIALGCFGVAVVILLVNFYKDMKDK